MSKILKSNFLYGVAFGNNTFVAVGASGTLLTSPDGENWTTGTSGHEGGKDLRGVIF